MDTNQLSGDNSIPAFKDIYRLLEALFDDVVISDGQGVIIWVSPSFEKTYGIASDQVVGKTSQEMERQQVFSPAVASLVLKSKQKTTIVEQNRQGKMLIVTGIPIFNHSGQIDRVISYSVDAAYFTELKKHHDHLENTLSLVSTELRELRQKQLERPGILSENPQMKNVLRLVKKVAAVDTNVLITGESGVGKNLIARLIHQSSSRKAGPFIEIDCGAIPGSLLESELFGYESGAFTGAQRSGKIGMIELAQNGTLFLDEISELPLNLQVKFLKLIQEKTLTRVGGTRPQKVDFRLIAATNRNLSMMTEAGQFREDLYYRLNVVSIGIPPLRERTEDILPLTQFFLDQANAEFKSQKTIANDALDLFSAYAWPGNIRQLKNIVESLVIITDETVIMPENLPDYMKNLSQNHPHQESTLKTTLREKEREIVQQAYDQCPTSVGVAKALGISQPSASRKIKEYIHNYADMNDPDK